MTVAVSIELSKELYERVRQVAARSGQPIEKVFVEGMAWWYNNMRADDATLHKLSTLSDVELWAVVYQRLPVQDEERTQELLQKGNEGRLTSEEQVELENLVKLEEHQMLLRSEALVLLKQRGHDIDTYFYNGEKA